MWFRTLHSKNDDYFAWVVNENGTISSKENSDLVLGYGISPNEEHWKDLSNSYSWNEFKKIEGFESTEEKKEDEELGNCLKKVGEDRWMEIPWACMDEYNIAWLRTWHDGNPAHFTYTFNKDGTISPEEEPDLVWGLADPSPCGKFKELLANHLGWKKSRAEKRVADEEKFGKIDAIVEEKVNKIMEQQFKELEAIIDA